MASINFTITDKDSGGVAIVFKPTMKELIDEARRRGKEETPASFIYAHAFGVMAKIISHEMARAKGAVDQDEARIMMPSLEIIKDVMLGKAWNPNQQKKKR